LRPAQYLARSSTLHDGPRWAPRATHQPLEKKEILTKISLQQRSPRMTSELLRLLLKPSSDAIPVPTVQRSCLAHVNCARSPHNIAIREPAAAVVRGGDGSAQERDDCCSAIRGTLMTAPSPGPRPVKTIKASAAAFGRALHRGPRVVAVRPRAIRVGSTLTFSGFITPSTSPSQASQSPSGEMRGLRAFSKNVRRAINGMLLLLAMFILREASLLWIRTFGTTTTCASRTLCQTSAHHHLDRPRGLHFDASLLAFHVRAFPSMGTTKAANERTSVCLSVEMR
jgi:hypothetical protein